MSRMPQRKVWDLFQRTRSFQSRMPLDHTFHPELTLGPEFAAVESAEPPSRVKQ
jgi:hypothetical protein